MHGVVAVFWEVVHGEAGELMQARVWGCRGSVAAPGPDTVKYGGNTSCVEVRLASGHALVLDAGHRHAPARRLDAGRPSGRAAHHAHASPPGSSAGSRLLPAAVRTGPRHPHLGPDVAGAAPRGAHRDVPVAAAVPRSARRRARRSITFHDAPEEPVTHRLGDDPRREGHPPGPDRRLPHRGGRSLASSTSPITSRRSAPISRPLPAAWMSGHDIARDADVLLHDGQYRDHEYGAHVGWGHSSIGDAMEFANKADVDKLVLFHHDPYHTDDELEALLERRARQLAGHGGARLPRLRGHDDRARRRRRNTRRLSRASRASCASRQRLEQTAPDRRTRSSAARPPSRGRTRPSRRATRRPRRRPRETRAAAARLPCRRSRRPDR